MEEKATNRNTLLSCYSKDPWRSRTFNYKIKKICCGGLETLILTECNQLLSVYATSSTNTQTTYLTQIDDQKYKIEFSKFLKDQLKIDSSPKIVNLFGSYSLFILQLENNEIILLKFSYRNFTGKLLKCNIKMIGHGPVSNKLIVIDENDKFRIFSSRSELEVTLSDALKLILNNFLKTGIKIISCGGDFSVIVTNDNKMFVEGPNTFNSQSGVSTHEFEYTYLQTSFENKSTIKQVKCGYYHTVVLLENGTVYASGKFNKTLKNSWYSQININIINKGYNNLKQCGNPNINENLTFTEFILPIGLNVKEIGCTSRGTYFTTKDKVYFVGEVVGDLDREKFGHVQAHCLSLNYQYSPTKHFQFNTVVPGGWHYIVYNQLIEEESKSIMYFKNNLQASCTTDHNTKKEQLIDLSFKLFDF